MLYKMLFILKRKPVCHILSNTWQISRKISCVETQDLYLHIIHRGNLRSLTCNLPAFSARFVTFPTFTFTRAIKVDFQKRI